MKMKTAELTGAALDWAVAKCGGELIVFDGEFLREPPAQFSEELVYSPSKNWSQGGPIIERGKITVSYDYDQKEFISDLLYASEDNFYMEVGSTPLIAAMRCYVASKLGDEVEVPDELI